MIKYSLILLIASSIVSCKEVKTEDVSSLKENNLQIEFDRELINGVWAEDKESNALFYIENDSIFYTGQQDKPYAIKLDKNSFSISYDNYISKAEILKLTKDSLVYVSSKNITRLYRRTE
ncbi:hypothetical protein [uncultured Aquimarina sp.]|uniref:hypothetical protein n=1 Tax=uncultured Aquimarina sp. TaxID=575652 RepID=UPI0026100369|nr:hypothetical protein [uncultured Aquimarina sp.]